MTSETVWAKAARTDRLGTVQNLARENAFAALLVATLLGVIGTVHVLLAPADHLQVSLLGVLIVLWSLTTLVALGGAYASLVSYIEMEPQLRLEILPEDERRILEPILETPGITQVEVVARSDYSDAKVSQTLKGLRERGLVYREPQGRTYRLYPGTVLGEATSESWPGLRQ